MHFAEYQLNAFQKHFGESVTEEYFSCPSDELRADILQSKQSMKEELFPCPIIKNIILSHENEVL